MAKENKEMVDDVLDMLFPVGEERWVKIKYLDLKKCIKAFKLSNYTKKEEHEEQGYEVTAIGIQDEYSPQVSALMDVRDEVTTILAFAFENTDDYRLNEIRSIFKSKIEEVLSRTVKHKK